MTKMIVTDEHECVALFHDRTLGEIGVTLDELTQLYGPDAKLRVDTGAWTDCDPAGINVLVRREETDAEYAERTRKEIAQKDEERAYRLAQYKRLRAEFPDE